MTFRIIISEGGIKFLCSNVILKYYMVTLARSDRNKVNLDSFLDRLSYEIIF